MTALRRLDRLAAGRVEVAIVFKEILGTEDAAAYMAQNGIPQHVADRVLACMTTTRSSAGAIVGYCQHDPEVPTPIAFSLRPAPEGQNRLWPHKPYVRLRRAGRPRAAATAALR
jgi:hypothetical protein